VKRLVLVVVGLWVLTPLAVLGIWSAARAWRYPDLLPEQWSAGPWRQVLDGAGPALLTSAVIGLVVAATATAVALPAARALAWHRIRARGLVEVLVVAPLLVPPFASVMGVQVVFVRAGLADTPLGVVLAHLIPAVPYAVLLLRAAHSGLDPDLERQARTLGSGPFTAWAHSTLPALAPAVAAAFGFAFLISWSEYLMTVIIGGGSVSTWPLLLFSAASGTGSPAVTAALALAGVAPPVLLLAAGVWLVRTRRSR
jgi:putative spermidine/putrescine transport system permease protein